MHHISEDGKIRECNAKPGNCPVTGPDGKSYHSEDKEDLIKINEEVLENKYKLESLKKDVFKKYYNSIEGHPFVEQHKEVVKGNIPDDFTFPTTSTIDGDSEFLNGISAHEELMQAGMYARISKKFCEDVANIVGKEAVILDPLASKGFFVNGMNEAGVKTIGSDLNPGTDNIEQLDALEAIDKYGDEVTHVAIIWPYMNTLDLEILKKLEKEHPDVQILRIGEGFGGCTGSEEFFDYLDENGYQEEFLQTNYRTPLGLNDYPSIIKKA